MLVYQGVPSTICEMLLQVGHGRNPLGSFPWDGRDNIQPHHAISPYELVGSVMWHAKEYHMLKTRLIRKSQMRTMVLSVFTKICHKIIQFCR